MRAIGIDLGASKAVMAALEQGEPRPLLNREGSPLLAAALAVDSRGRLLVGHAALGGDGEPARLFLPRLGEGARVVAGGFEYTPEELTALLLATLGEDAQAALGGRVGRAAFAVPLSCGQRQMAALSRAARAAGLFATGFLPSPVAAALAYSRAHPGPATQTLLVADFGAANLSVAVVHSFPGALTVLGQAGEAWLGGEELTQGLAAHLLRRLQGRRELLLDESLATRQALRRQLRRAAEQAKVALSIVEEVPVHLAAEALGLPAALDEVLTRAQFAELAGPRLQEGLAVVERALAAAGLAGEAIDTALLVGGSAQVPLWRTLVQERLPRARLVGDVNPLLCVAAGTALWAAMRNEVRCPTCGQTAPLQARTCRRCGARLAGERRATCPRCFRPNDPGRSSCARCGASLRGARRAPRGPTPLADGAPAGLRCTRCGLVARAGAASCPACGEVLAPFVGLLSRGHLGVEREGGRMDVILPCGHALPSARPVYRSFAAGSAPRLEVPLYEGDKPFVAQNERVALVCVALPEEREAGAGVRVSFSLDGDGRPLVGATLAGGRGQVLDAWLEWQ